MFGGIGVDGEMECDASGFASQGIDHRVLHPDAGMIQFRLMAGGKQRCITGMAYEFARLTAKFRERDALQQNVIGTCQSSGIFACFRQQRRGVWPDQHLAVVCRGLPVGIAGRSGMHADSLSGTTAAGIRLVLCRFFCAWDRRSIKLTGKHVEVMFQTNRGLIQHNPE